nr:hypothetical protein [Paludibacteraceae bacterium]
MGKVANNCGNSIQEQTTDKTDKLEPLLKECCEVLFENNEKKTIPNFKSRIRCIQKDAKEKKEDIIKWLEDAIKNKEESPYDYAMCKIEDLLDKCTNICDKTKKSRKSAFRKFALFVLGQYDADLYMGLNSRYTDKEFCKLVAKYALFCKVAIAEQVKKGDLGSDENIKNGGNNYYSWFYCMFQRKSGSTQKVGESVKDPQDKDVKFKDKEVKYDNNNMANQAIKKAVNAGLTCRLGEYKLFEGYMACHIWDDSCHNNLFHTSVFNLVLLPKAIGGLTDYNSNVKKLLQYEAAWRFGVYP